MRYMFAFFTEETGWDDVTPEQMQAGIKVWADYEQALRDAGAYIAGEGLQPSPTATLVKVGEGDERLVTDGPFAETKEQLGGFYLIDVDDLDDALGWAKQVPLQTGGSIEVRPVMDYSQFAGDDVPAAAEARS